VLDKCSDARQHGNDKLFEPLFVRASSGKASLTRSPLAVISGTPRGDPQSSVFTFRHVPKQDYKVGKRNLSWPQRTAALPARCRAGGPRHSSLKEETLQWLRKHKENQP